MIRTPANFFRKYEKFANDSGTCKVRKGKTGILEYSRRKAEWRSFDMKTSAHKAAMFSFAFHGSYYMSELE